jgi:CrcB protein
MVLKPTPFKQRSSDCNGFRFFETIHGLLQKCYNNKSLHIFMINREVHSWMVYFTVGIGGIIGALLRYYLGLFITDGWGSTFPLATLLINFIGCFVLAWSTAFLARTKIIPPSIVTGLGTGLIGSFTTFSTFSVETVRLLQSSFVWTAFIYTTASLLGGLFLTWAGYRLGDWLFRRQNKEGKNHAR